MTIASRLNARSIPEVVWIRERFTHMGKHSGYDMLCVEMERSLSNTHSVYPAPVENASRIERAIIERVYPRITKPLYYGEHHLLAELRALRHCIFKQKLIHVLYAENNLGVTALTQGKLRNKVVATFHQPRYWWQEKKLNLRALISQLDAAIVLSGEEQREFSREAPGRVHFVPHGVDTTFFRPSDSAVTGNKFNCLFVGQWLRDFPTLEQVIRIAASHHRDIDFHLVIPADRLNKHIHKDCIERIIHLPQVTHYSGITDAQLLELYQRAHVLLLPLERSTANNAIVESLACGLPVVTTELPAARDYVDEHCGLFSAMQDAEAMADNILKLYADRAALERMGSAARRHAVDNLDWQHIASRTIEIYQSTL